MGGPDRDLTPSSTISDKDMHIRFGEKSPGNRLGVEVDQRSHSWNSSPNRDFIVIDYSIYNTSLYGDLDSLYFGLWSDFDVSDFPGSVSLNRDDNLSFDYSRNLIYMFDGDNPDSPEDDTGEPDSLGALRSPGYIGTALLCPDSADVHLSWWRLFNDPDFWDDPTLYQLLSNPQNIMTPDSLWDYRTLLSVGPLRLAQEDSIRVVVGYVIGVGWEQLQRNTDQMRSLFEYVDMDNPPLGLPQRFSLLQNYPNPFNPITLIKYTLPRDCQVALVVYNILGQKVAVLVDGKQKAGFKTVGWDAGSLSSGIYFYRLKAADFVQTRRMVVLK